MSRVTVKVLTLNCWALPSDYLPCKLRGERINAIGKELAKGNYDVVLLQEIWSQCDFEKLVAGTIQTLKYSHYFHSGMFGSGLCVFSKHPIVETFQRRFSLNGFAHRIMHGDWFGGKAVGLAQIVIDGFTVNFYLTHTHAAYESSSQNDYLAIRMVQAYELGQFIKHTSQSCDAVVVGGDFNLLPEDSGCKLVVSNANMLDSWEEQIAKVGRGSGFTSNVTGNSFRSASVYEDQQRIDYLLYRNNSGFDMVCEECRTCMDKVPGTNYNFSDHQGVEATYQVRRNVTGMAPERDVACFRKQVPDIKLILKQGIDKAYSDRRKYYLIAVISLLLLILTADWSIGFGLDFILAMYRTATTLIAGYALINAIILNSIEVNGLIATIKDLEILDKSYATLNK